MKVEVEDYEAYLQAINRIDRLLQRPIETLAELMASRHGAPPDSGAPAPVLPLPPRLVEGIHDQAAANLNSALCCSTLQRIWIHRRRFPGLEKKLRKLHEALAAQQDPGQPDSATVQERLASPFLRAGKAAGSFAGYATLFANPHGCALDPTTAAQVLWVLLNAGETNAYSSAGFMAFFFILWAVRRKLPEPGGVAAGGTSPSAYVTAKALSPLLRLLSILRRRAGLLQRIADSIDAIQRNQHGRDPLHPMRLDELTTQLQEFSTIAMSRQGFIECVRKLDEIADESRIGAPSGDCGEAGGAVDMALLEALHKVGTVGRGCTEEAKGAVKAILPDFVQSLAGGNAAAVVATLRRELSYEAPAFRDARSQERFSSDIAEAARAALEDTNAAFDLLDDAVTACQTLTAEQPRMIPEVFKKLARANRVIADRVEQVAIAAIEWCEEVCTRQVAHASAKNHTEFDPAELLGSLFVAVAGRRMESSLAVQDAINKALTGMRSDGSWLPGQPFLVVGYLGAWAPTSDLMWLLSSTLDRLPTIRTADAALLMFVDWLERTQRRIRYDESTDALLQPLIACGWISERDLLPKGIDLWATAYAINALLGIREIMEYRLWEICEKRFMVLIPDRKLSLVDAVDLGVAHKFRLHRRLARMMRKASGDDFKEADYSLILHGPPGSSKTAIAAALASEMWRSADGSGKLRGRLIRITPADFTRLGESRLDSEARIIFDLLKNIRGATVLFDEIDDLLRRRERGGAVAFLDLVVPAMLNRLQDLRDACPAQELCFVMATNYIERMEPALIRKGRIDHSLALVYPDRESRWAILAERIERLDGTDAAAASRAAQLIGECRDVLLTGTDYWPWKTFDGFCGEVCRALQAQPSGQAGAPRFDMLLAQYRAKVQTQVYSKTRFKRTSPELKDEVAEYFLSGSGNTQEAVERLIAGLPDAGNFRNQTWTGDTNDGRVRRLQPAAAAALEATYGDGMLALLNAKAGLRGWAPLDFGSP